SARSVARDHRGAAAEVEAPDQLAADGLHILAAVEELAGEWHSRRIHELNPIGAVVGEAIFGLPEQTREPADAVFIARADEPARIGMLHERHFGRLAIVEREVDLAELRLGVSAGDEDHEIGGRPRDPANAAARGPGILELLLPD